MQTECPHCNTVFRLTDTQLRMADGMVRCGLCHQTFNALYSDNAAPGDNPTAEDTPDLFDDGFFDEPASAVVPDEFRHTGTRRSKLWSFAWSCAIILLALALVIEIAWFERNEIQKNTQLKPWVEQFCALAGCKLEALRDAEKIEMLSRNVYTHPNEKNALMVAVTITNHAAHAQPYPDMQIDFSNVRGTIVAARRFTPEEYLSLDTAELPLLPAGTDASFSLEILDPGKEALTYEFSFL